MKKSKRSIFVRRLAIGVWTLSVVSAALWLWVVLGPPIGSDLIFDAANASAVAAGFAALLLGISVAVVRPPLSLNIILSFVVSFTVCAWTGYFWWAIDQLRGY